MNNVNNFEASMMFPHILNGNNLLRSWVSGNYDIDKVININSITGAKIHSVNGAIGLEKDISSYNLVGVALGYAYSEIKGNNKLYNGSLQTVHFGIYDKLRLGKRAYLKSWVDYNLGFYALKRHVMAVNNNNSDPSFTSNTTSTPTVGNLGLNSVLFFNLYPNKIINLLFYGGGGFWLNNMQDYNEQGYGALSVKGFTTIISNANAGFLIVHEFKITSKQVFIPTFKATAIYTYYNLKTTTASFGTNSPSASSNTDTGNSFNISNPKYKRFTVIPQLELNYLIGKKFSTSIYANAGLNKDFQDQTLGIDIKFAF